MALIKAENLDLGYEGKTIVDGLNFEINPGNYLCIIGENGSGKSTLMKTILGLLNPLDGKLTYGDGLKKNEIGYLPQQTSAQRDFPASVREVVQSGLLNKCGLRPFFTPKQKAMVKENMEKMKITHLADRCYRELSGGQQQRVLLARALCASSRLLLLDEPVSGLDPKVTQDMYEVIKELNESGITVIMISHDISAAILYATHILHVSHTPLFFGTTDDYLNSEIGKTFAGNALKAIQEQLEDANISLANLTGDDK
ncbi:MAG: metal ABC transporter ATP-binding protein [Clostridia bacterium]|nr:metal ABC transporter ATP-binding protein [Clostridia bacterium]